MSTPHYVRFARSLALLGGLGAVGCPTTNSTEPDAATSPANDAFTAAGEDAAPAGEDAHVAMADAFSADDATAPTDAFDVCASCVCTGFAPDDAGIDAGRPDCLTVPGAEICCAAIGPLSPPDLAV